MEQVQTTLNQWLHERWKYWLGPAVIIVGAVICALIAHYVVFRLAARYAKRSGSIAAASLVKRCRAPSRLILPLLAINVMIPSLRLSPELLAIIRQTLGLLLIVTLAWLIVRVILVIEDVVLSRYRIDVKDNLRARTMRTQVQLLRKVLVVVVTVVTLATALMTFEKVRQLGTTLLASAGIAGIIIGIAAQRSIAALIAGVQMALTQPIRVDDVVIVENEWGRIEEITLTYVVVRIWDLRRLIVPTTYFLEKPFQNWTRVSADLLGTVFLYVDYTVPLEEVRAELKRLAENSELWDGQVCVLQVTETTEHTMQLRALVSASDASNAWTLRCEIREKLVEFIQKNYPRSLPRLRADFHPDQSMPDA
jgi:small-conductance mechanosensitive channel